MHKLVTVALLAALAAMPYATQAAEGKTLTPQQQKMSDCSKDAKSKSLKGDERKAFMKTCLSKGGGTSGAAPAESASAGKKAEQNEKMKACSADAKSKGLKGDDRKAFMKTCLSASA